MTYKTNAHPFFAINLSRNFDVDSDELRSFIMAMPAWKYVELEGVESNGNDADIMYIWTCDQNCKTTATYDLQEFVDFLNTSGFGIPQKDVVVVHNYRDFTCECCNFAPVISLSGISYVESIYGNVDNAQLYLSKVFNSKNR